MNPGDNVKYWRDGKGTSGSGWKLAKLLSFATQTTGTGKRKVVTEVAKVRPIGKAKTVTVPKDNLQPA